MHANIFTFKLINIYLFKRNICKLHCESNFLSVQNTHTLSTFFLLKTFGILCLSFLLSWRSLFAHLICGQHFWHTRTQLRSLCEFLATSALWCLFCILIEFARGQGKTRVKGTQKMYKGWTRRRVQLKENWPRGCTSKF